MKDVAYYRTLPYHRIVRLVEEDGEVDFVAFVEELPALEIDAPTREEALFRLDEMFDEHPGSSRVGRGDSRAEAVAGHGRFTQ